MPGLCHKPPTAPSGDITVPLPDGTLFTEPFEYARPFISETTITLGLASANNLLVALSKAINEAAANAAMTTEGERR